LNDEDIPEAFHRCHLGSRLSNSGVRYEPKIAHFCSKVGMSASGSKVSSDEQAIAMRDELDQWAADVIKEDDFATINVQGALVAVSTLGPNGVIKDEIFRLEMIERLSVYDLFQIVFKLAKTDTETLKGKEKTIVLAFINEARACRASVSDYRVGPAPARPPRRAIKEQR
jgi:hypothetical protein